MKVDHMFHLRFSEVEVIELMLLKLRQLRDQETPNSPEWDQLDMMLNHAQNSICSIDFIGNDFVLMVDGSYTEDVEPDIVDY